ncbi:MAG: hypothetical protein GWP91_19720 [Rhodobacterales bacterium]|nr:hypothetical protein [Rhodobacterales bacterium]
MVSAPGTFGSLGEVQIFLGPIAAAFLPAAPDLIIQGAVGGDRLGQSIALSDDPTGDSCAGLVVGATKTGPSWNRGSVYLLDLNTPTFPGPGTVLGVSGSWVTFNGINLGKLRTTVATGDWNGDGSLDLFMGAPLYYDGIQDVVLGAPSTDQSAGLGSGFAGRARPICSTEVGSDCL